MRNLFPKGLPSGAAILLTLCLSSPSFATAISFSYTTEGDDVFSGVMEGELQPDGDTFVVSSVGDPRLNGVPGPDLTLVGAFSNGTVGSDLPPTVSLNGSFMDIVACSTPLCDGETFFFDSIGLEAPFLFPAFYATAAYGGVFEGYEPVRWSASVSAPVSAPAPLAAMAVPGLLLLMRRRV